eukprot:3940799-Rhodomonas_salina.4
MSGTDMAYDATWYPVLSSRFLRRACYKMSGTNFAYDATRLTLGMQEPSVRRTLTLPGCPRMLRACYAMSDTSGTVLTAATLASAPFDTLRILQCPVLNLGNAAARRSRSWAIQYWRSVKSAIGLRARYAIPGTDAVYATSGTATEYPSGMAGSKIACVLIYARCGAPGHAGEKVTIGGHASASRGLALSRSAICAAAYGGSAAI